MFYALNYTTHTACLESMRRLGNFNAARFAAVAPQIPEVEVWFQRASDIVRKLTYGDIDLGFVGLDMYEGTGAGAVHNIHTRNAAQLEV